MSRKTRLLSKKVKPDSIASLQDKIRDPYSLSIRGRIQRSGRIRTLSDEDPTVVYEVSFQAQQYLDIIAFPWWGKNSKKKPELNVKMQPKISAVLLFYPSIATKVKCILNI